MKIMMTRKMLLGLLFFVIAIFAMASASAYIMENPEPTTGYDESGWDPITVNDLIVKSTNGTLYTVWDPGMDTNEIGLFESTDGGYNWTFIHLFGGEIQTTSMALDSSGDLRMLFSENSNKLSYVVFNLTTLTNTTHMVDTIGGTPSGAYGCQMLINSTDGIRAIYKNDTTHGIYFYNGSTWDWMPLPEDSDFMSAGCLAANDTIYIASQYGSGNILGVYCFDEVSGGGLILLDTYDTGDMFSACIDIMVNNTTLMINSIGLGSSGFSTILVSDLPAISFTEYDWPVDNSGGTQFFWMNGSRIEYGTPTDDDRDVWNFSYIDGTTWINHTTVRIKADGATGKIYLFPRTARNHEPDFFSETLDLLGMIKIGGKNYVRFLKIFPNAAPSFLNLTVDTTYNEPYSVNIDPKDLNPQDNVTSVLQNMSAEDDWLGYSGGVLSGTVGETDYNNTTVWVRISFDDGTTNFTYNFTFDSERIQLLYTTTLPHGYLNIHYRGTIRAVDNTTWYAVTNAGWASVDNTTGEITGYPSSRGNFWFHIYLDDVNSNNTDDWNITVVIGISPGDTASQITELIVPILIAVVGLVITIAVLFGVFGSLGSTFNRFGKS